MTIFEARERAISKLMSIPGVIGVGVSLIRNTIVVYVEKEAVETLSAMPAEIEGHKVEFLETGKFQALKW